MLGLAIRNTGLADRAAQALTARLSGSYPRLVAGVVLMTYALAFVMPSNMGRIAVLMPIVLAVADRAGLHEGSEGRIGLALAVGFGTFMLSCSILPANVPNLVMAGSIETEDGIRLTYLPYLILHAPVLGVLKGFALAGCICLLFRAQPAAVQAAGPPGALSPSERRLSVLLAATLLLWLTDSLHGISPAWIGLAAACVCLLPGVGFVSHEEFATQVNFRTAIYVAGILGMAAMVTRTGLADRLGHALLAVAPLDPAAPFRSFATLVGISSALNFVVTSNGVPALYTPLAKTSGDRLGPAAADSADGAGARLLGHHPAVSGGANRGRGADGTRSGQLRRCGFACCLPRSPSPCWCRWISCGSNCWDCFSRYAACKTVTSVRSLAEIIRLSIPGGRRSSARTRASSSSDEYGLSTQSSAPASSAAMRRSRSVTVVPVSTGMPRPRHRMSRTNASPSPSGNSNSISTTS